MTATKGRKAMIAAIGADGTRLVVWGLGATEDEAEADARTNEADGVALAYIAVSDAEAVRVGAGTVGLKDLGIDVRRDGITGWSRAVDVRRGLPRPESGA